MAWFCLTCSKTLFPFSELNEEELCSTIQGKKIKFVAVSKRRSENEHILVYRINDVFNETNKEDLSAYFNINDFNSTLDSKEFNNTNFLHLNIASLSYNFDEFYTLLSQLNIKFDIGISASQLKKISSRNNNINLDGYFIEHTPT